MVPNQLTPEDQLWMDEAQKARLSQLQTVRTAGKDWASTIAAVTGALGIVTLIKGPEEIGRLTREWEIAVGVALLCAVLLSLRGIVLAAVAAQGTPRSFGFSPAQYRSHYLRETRLAATQLRVSRIVTVLATLAVTTAVGLAWYGEEEPETVQNRVYAVTNDGTTVCGALSVGASGVLLVKESRKAQPTTLEPGAVRGLVATDACPRRP